MSNQEQNRPVKFAYVGCGFVAQNIHIPNFKSLRECEFVALAEARPGLGQQVAEYYGIPRVYASHEDIAADREIEAVGVSGPYALQGAIAEDLLRAGKHVFMEKPMAVSVARAQGIVDAEQKSGKRLMVGYMKRYDPGNVLLKSIADEWRATGEVGPVVFARNHGFGGNWVYAQDPNVKIFAGPEGVAPPPAPDECPAWLPDAWKNAYLGYLQQWTHNLNLLRFFLDDTAGTARVVDVHLNDDGMTGLSIFNINGTRAIVESAYLGFHAWEEHTQLYFQGGWLRTEAPPLMQKNTPATVEVYRSAHNGRAPRQTQHFASPQWAYREEARHFLSRVQSGEPFHSSARDTLTDVRLFEEIYRHFLAGRSEL
ncbi:MAG TPA: Gfo/Idh/MocA family oxidoreductase [Abditibacteriaceae bacterium]|jgi:predicted dehydrogenase